MRVLLDTNVVVSALLFPGPPRRLLLFPAHPRRGGVVRVCAIGEESLANYRSNGDWQQHEDHIQPEGH